MPQVALAQPPHPFFMLKGPVTPDTLESSPRRARGAAPPSNPLLYCMCTAVQLCMRSGTKHHATLATPSHNTTPLCPMAPRTLPRIRKMHHNNSPTVASSMRKRQPRMHHARVHSRKQASKPAARPMQQSRAEHTSVESITPMQQRSHATNVQQHHMHQRVPMQTHMHQPKSPSQLPASTSFANPLHRTAPQ